MRRISHKFVLPLLAALLSLSVVSSALAQDPGATGPFAVTKSTYNDGDTAFNPGTFPGPAEVRASVHRPTNLTGGPFPLIIFLHGRHGVCKTGGFTWPCPAGTSDEIASFEGYDYVASVLASHGYIVVSIGANGVNARDNSTADLGAQWRAELIQHHLNKWNTFNTTGGAPFGSTFVGKVNMQNVGTMGHSRGGEGVMRHFLYNQSLGSPYGIKAIFPLAPVDFNRPIINGVPFEVLLPYCDGDVSDLQGVHFYDDARYSAPGDLTRKHTLLVMGANHNYYNTVWTTGIGSSDDWGGVVGDPHCDQGQPRRLTAAQQRGTGLAYMSAFFRRYLGSETVFDPILRGDVPAPPSATTNDLFSSYHAPDSAAERRDVNRLLTASHLSTNQLGGSVTQTGITPYDLCGGLSPQPLHCLSASSVHQPHTTPSARSAARGLSQLRGGWMAATATFTNNLPAGSRDVSNFLMFQFRASVNYEDGRNPVATPQDFIVRLTDGTGATADTTVSAFSDALFYPPGSMFEVPKVVLNTIRIPMSAFSSLNLADIRSVQFRFNQTGSGALLITDLAFTDAGVAPGLPDLVESALSNPPASVSPGGNFSVNDTATNSGAAGAAASTTRFYLSLDTSKGAGDILLTGTRAVPPLAIGGVSAGMTNVTVPAGTAPNTYFLLACADDTAIVGESNEGNNCRASATTVQVLGGGGGPDYVVSALANPPASVARTVNFPMSTTVTNQGSAAVLIKSKVRFYLSLDTTWSVGDFLMGGGSSTPALAAGASKTKVPKPKAKASTPLGTYFVIACADDLNVIAEGAAGEANNCRSSTTMVTITP